MPTYIYSCPKCNKTYEIFRKITDADHPILCDEDLTPLRKIIQGGTFILKGSWPGKDIKRGDNE